MLTGATVTLAGYVANNPIYTTINNATPKVTMRVAWTTRYPDRVTGEWRDGNTSFATVNCWRKLASNVATSLRKGEAIVVTGRLQVREYEDREGRRRLAVDIEADTVGHDMSRGVTHFLRTRPTATDGQPDGVAAGAAARPGLEAGSAADQGEPVLTPAGQAQPDGAGTPEDVFDADAVAEFAATADSSLAAAVPF